MSTVDVTQVIDLATTTAVDVLESEYQPDAGIYTSFIGDVIAPADASSPFYGDKSTTLHATAGLQKREDGQEFPAQTMGQGYAPQGRIDQFGAVLKIPARTIAAAQSQSGRNEIASLVEAFVSGKQADWALEKDKAATRLFNKGALTAGDTEAFDGSFPGQIDSTGGVIYDGLPFFDTAHVIKFGSSTYSNHTASLALTSANLDTAYTLVTYTNAIDERGENILNPVDTLMVPPSLRRTATQLLDSELEPGSANNDTNTNRGLLSIVVNRHLTDSDGWFLLNSQRGIRAIDSGPLVARVWYDESIACVCVSLEGHRGFYVRDWRPFGAFNVAAS